MYEIQSVYVEFLLESSQKESKLINAFMSFIAFKTLLREIIFKQDSGEILLQFLYL